TTVDHWRTLRLSQRSALRLYTTLFRSVPGAAAASGRPGRADRARPCRGGGVARRAVRSGRGRGGRGGGGSAGGAGGGGRGPRGRSEEHTSELQSREKLVCRLLLEKTNC